VLAPRRERLVVSAGPARRGNGQELRFRAASDFVYLAGDGSAGGVLVLEPDSGGHVATWRRAGHSAISARRCGP